MIVMPTTYSPMTVARSFQLVEEFELSGRVLHVIYDSQTPRAAIIEADIETFDGVPRHRVVAALDLQRKAQLGKDIVAVERCWEDANLVQVEGICVAPGERDKGLATRLYEALILQCGITLVSDFEQYDGGKMLWQKIARESDHIVVFVLDTEQSAFWPYDGSKVVYDGGCIPEERIWSLSPDQKCHGIVLVAESKTKASQMMEDPARFRI
ncbi:MULTISPECIES: GNAT family N-acetyltransferase [Lelliottia]|uniref:GNAT family N-acetyltransferase n=1 Tax=Lelliottia wanjuensis TaxID=3050585 RepID=A0AAP4FY22_9ENTR|nr:MULTISPECIES: GNAT family N-acetyltransferase [unclassified Lelliottia]MDI3362281.1 GNAT family N-acetyltransferase [Lelliottia sp. V89_13]MDK9358128.1 GNAT family N-acetyltransferase [Lelliottia sp. V106_16]MDK9365816.1 GNAT family N-acetyltransferase [Lelliottia sp. V106_12]MDK9374345.1 GNAT family N-acetyltransferase [Lelliottia sp. V106_10]MDK9551462.1 GNAT family N-acetyltransferase [Lelliottia sp. V89_5]